MTHVVDKKKEHKNNDDKYKRLPFIDFLKQDIMDNNTLNKKKYSSKMFRTRKCCWILFIRKKISLLERK